MNNLQRKTADMLGFEAGLFVPRYGRLSTCSCTTVCPCVRMGELRGRVCVWLVRCRVRSGTMGNLIAVGVHCERGQEVLLGTESHIFNYEQGGVSCTCAVLCCAVLLFLWWVCACRCLSLPSPLRRSADGRALLPPDK